MIEVKAFEIRDAGTFIAAVGIRTTGTEPKEAWLWRRAGFSANDPLVLLVKMESCGQSMAASYDPYEWGLARTMPTAHLHIQNHWQELSSGAVICVETLLGERTTPKESEMEAEHEN